MSRNDADALQWPIDRQVLGTVLSLWYKQLARAHGQRRRATRQRESVLDLLSWGRKYLPQHFRRAPSAMHVWLARRLGRAHQTRGIKLNVLGPRGGAKSTIGTLCYPLQAALEFGEAYIWIVSDTKHQACAHLENIKAELLDNELLAEDFSDAIGRGPVWRSNMIVLRNGVTIEALGTGQRIRGRRRRANRPTLIVCDDLQNDSHAASATLREQSRNWFHSALTKAGTARTNVMNLATALHRDALALELARTPGWTSRIFRAIVRWPENMSLWQEWEAIYSDLARAEYHRAAEQFYLTHRQEMDQGAAVLWPEEESLYSLMCMRVEGGRAAFEREKQNAPINPELCEWPESHFDESIWCDRWPANLVVKTMALDPSKGSDARRSDYSALVMLGVDRQGMVYVEADLARRPSSQIVIDGTEWYCRFRPDVFGVESNQFQDLLAGEFEAAFRRQGILGPRPVPLDNRVAKLVRIRRLGPYLSSRRLKFLANSPGTKLLVEQLRDFPIGDHDDGPDALEMSLRLAGEVLQGRAFRDGLGNRLPV